MTQSNLKDTYRSYIECLNRQDWDNLGNYVDDKVSYNGVEIGLSGYRALLEKDFREIPDLHFNIKILISDASYIASRLDFHVAPAGQFFGLPVNGRRVSFSENVFYEFKDHKILNVWSVIDKAAIEAQL